VDLIANHLHHFPCHFRFSLCFLFFPYWSSITLGYRTPTLTPTICVLEKKTHEMSPKKRLGKELLVEGPSQGTGAQALEATQATTQQQISSVPPQATIEVGRPEEPLQQPPRQAEVLTMDTFAPTTQHPNQQQNNKGQEELEQDSEEEIESVIEDALARLRQENERLRLMQEQMARRKAMVKRAHVM
jgi:hypothetical protein